MLLYHHCRELEHIVYGEINPNPKLSNQDLIGAYQWLEKEVGFYPLFLSVGKGDYDDMIITGYADNWRVQISRRYEDGKYKSELRKAGEFPNDVLFSFENVDGVFNDFDNWHLVLNSSYNDYKMSNYDKKLILKPSWPRSKWLRKAERKHGSVQLVAPRLYLPDAKRVWVRNKKTKRILEDMGFNNVEVKRIPVPRF